MEDTVRAHFLSINFHFLRGSKRMTGHVHTDIKITNVHTHTIKHTRMENSLSILLCTPLQQTLWLCSPRQRSGWTHWQFSAGWSSQTPCWRCGYVHVFIFAFCVSIYSLSAATGRLFCHDCHPLLLFCVHRFALAQGPDTKPPTVSLTNRSEPFNMICITTQRPDTSILTTACARAARAVWVCPLPKQPT